MDALDEEMKDNILRNIGDMFPNVSDLSFFRQVFDNENWDLEKSLATIKSFLEYVDEEQSAINSPPNNRPRNRNSAERLAPNPVSTRNLLSGLNEPVSGFSTSGRNPVQAKTTMSYSSSVGAVPKSATTDKKVVAGSKAQRKERFLKAYNDGLKLKNPVLRIKSFAMEGIKVMIIMRGCPGSGKTYLVQHLANSLSSEQSKALGWDVTHPVDHHVFSADDFWINPAGKYVFNPEYIEYAHRWNQKLVRQAASEGRSPIFVDNTHTRLWEMQTVASIAVEYGYLIEIIESKEVNKKGAFNVNELVRRNVHQVHADAIRRMVDRYEHGIEPKDIFKFYNLSYQPNITPPQRCLVTFNVPPSKNQLKIFNARFHHVPLKDILALKSSDAGADNIKTKNSAYGGMSQQEQVDNNRSVFGEFPQKDGSSVQYPSQFRRVVPPSLDQFPGVNPFSSSHYQDRIKRSQSSPGHNPVDQQRLRSPEYTWPSSYSADTSPNSADTVDLLLALNDDAPDPKPKQPLQPIKRPVPDLGSSRPHIGHPSFNSSSDLLSFEDISQGASKSESAFSHVHTPKGDLHKFSPCSTQDDSDDDSSCEEIALTPSSNACNEFGQEVTLEYVLIGPDGQLKFQNSHEQGSITLEEFIATSKMVKLTKKLAESINARGSKPINKLLKPFLKTKFPLYSLLANEKRVSPSEEMLESARRANLAQGFGQKSDSIRDESLSSNSVHSEDEQIPESSETITYIMAPVTPKEALEEISNIGAKYYSFFKRQQSDSVASKSGVVESSGNAPKEPEPVRMSRRESPEGQRSPNNSSIKCDKGTDANYFEILSKSNSSGALPNNDVIRFGNADSFQCSPSPLKPDGVKSVATHEKSSMTKSDESADETDSGVEILTKMFPDVSLDCLVDLFDKCQNNLCWTANLLMDSGVEVSEHFIAEVVPRKASPPPPALTQAEEKSEPSSSEKESLTAPSSLKKMKKNKLKLTEEHINLVKEFESNFILNEDHYSETLKKVKETRFGRPVEAEPVEDTVEEPCKSRDSTPNDPESSSSDVWDDDDEGDMSLVVSNDFIGQLQNKFGHIPNIYGSELLVKLPVSLARQVYSYALDSICQQVEDEQNVFEVLVREDEAFARKLQEESEDSRGSMSFREIMDHEMALRAHEREQGRANAASSETFASRLSQQLLIQRFPNMDPVSLQNVLEVTNHSLHEATSLLAAAGHTPVDPAAQEAASNSGKEPLYTMTREESIEQANAYHEVAVKLNDMRQLYFQKATEAYNSGNHAVALFYKDLFNWYSDQIKASNAKAAKAMLHGNEGATTLDLHYLHVSEAVCVLDLFLDESIRQLSARKMEIFIITGRGLHSLDGKSRLKPAIKQRLKQRGLKFVEVNPGMLKTVITKSSSVSYKLSGVQ